MLSCQNNTDNNTMRVIFIPSLNTCYTYPNTGPDSDSNDFSVSDSYLVVESFQNIQNILLNTYL